MLIISLVGVPIKLTNPVGWGDHTHAHAHTHTTEFECVIFENKSHYLRNPIWVISRGPAMTDKSRVITYITQSNRPVKMGGY